MKFLRHLLLASVFTVFQAKAALPVIHIWETQELTFEAKNSYKNAYTEVTVWIDLAGPGFNKRVYGFWDGATTFRVRLIATQPGAWKWISGSSSNDPGLTGKTGSFTAITWSEKEKNENPLRRGFLKPSANNHALNYADGTPYFAIGDTWFSLGSNRFKWYNDEVKRPIGPQAGFKDYVRFRKAQGYNWVNMIVAYPNWKTDDSSWHIVLHDSARTTLRSAWVEYGTGSAKNMDNEGGRPFFFPGKVPGYENYFPDMDRINPEYFKYIDRKIAYLNAHGFIPFMEVSRRDAGPLWYKYHRWPDSYSRFILYVYARYQAYNTVLSPIHLDIIRETIRPEDYMAAITAMEKEYGPPPFGNLLSANANPSTLENWGEDSWVTLHQIGNKREHNNYWFLTEIYHAKTPKPALNGEPYYAGYKDARGGGGRDYSNGAEGGTERDNAFVRSGMYGSFLSGGLAGHVYGAEGIWGADIEPAAPIHLWEAFQWKSGAEMTYLKTFAFSIGKRYQDLVPLADLVSPNKNYNIEGYEGWAYCARTPDKNIFLAYFEKGCPASQIRGARLNSWYQAQWFNPRNGTWINIADGKLASNNIGVILLPEFPEDTDWGLKLIYKGTHNHNLILPTVLPEVAEKKQLKNKIKTMLTYGVVSFLIVLMSLFFIGRFKR
ncbi:hypothetical protein AHMF7605_26820 [Adhaeribacter arboris]|uniref:DUF4038 domain-containing protein n=1 Tax=Adhaeribacter arboris TaxID=2072846 RepID=A0A2T2YMV9_9BACT|nr:DUF4038 domain-containing protein [Adhaeribacter arboris]PSR56854.1 hypothetical protein AHMF7605_26820 [Adhaeribacter arboris]